MNMHDNDMDALFRSKLDGFEVEPSAAVWANISDELGKPVQRKSIAPLLRVAASVAILITAGLFFIVRDKKGGEVKPIVKPLQAGVVKTPVSTQPVTQVQPANPVVQANLQIASTKQPQQALAVVHHTKPAQSGAVNINPAVADPVKPEDVINNPQPATVLAATESKPAINKAVVPDVIITKSTDINPEFITKQPTVLAVNTPDNDAKQTPAKKRKIRGLGGFLNAVVGVVDKRADKIIEFTDTDEGDAVTGINLGIIKVKRDK